MMQLKLPQVRSFCALAEEGSLALAAEKMHCVPSNISTRIRELEHTLGVALVHREKQRLNLTPEGRAFYPQAKALLAQSEECLDFFRPTALKGVLRVGTLDVVLGEQLQQAAIQFMQMHPDVSLSLTCNSSQPLMEGLLAGELDIILADGPVEHPLLTSDYFAPESLALVTHLPSLAALREQSGQLALYTFGENCFYHVLTEAWLSQQKLQVRQHCEIESYPIILAAVHQHLGFTVMPQSFINDNPMMIGLNYFPLTDIPLCNIYVVWRQFSQSQVSQRFLDVLLRA